MRGQKPMWPRGMKEPRPAILAVWSPLQDIVKKSWWNLPLGNILIDIQLLLGYALDSEDQPWWRLPCVVLGLPVLYSGYGTLLCINRQHCLKMCLEKGRVSVCSFLACLQTKHLLNIWYATASVWLWYTVQPLWASRIQSHHGFGVQTCFLDPSPSVLRNICLTRSGLGSHWRLSESLITLNTCSNWLVI